MPGNGIQLEITIAGPLGDAPRTFTHGISFDPVQQLYTIDIPETSSHHRTTNQQAAIDVFGRFFGLNLAPEEDVRFPAVIDVRAGLTTMEPVGFDIAVLWNYHTPRFHIEFSSISDYEPGPETSR